ncbi:MAG: beta-ketoacyl-[acyl-carrier-protein] synthase family protein [Akkermansiaceae bacterium]|nr:beta-ketoacyl-[acyl-carrier-protein] synthase family protein [Akkermansiaceae bacterium]
MSPPPDQAPVKQRVFVTGMGMVSPMGNKAQAHVDSMRAGQTHFRPIDFFDVSRQRVQTAGVAELPGYSAGYAISERIYNRLDRGSQLLLYATEKAIEDAGMAAASDLPHGVPYVIGTSAAAMPLGEDYFKAETTEPFSRRGQLTRIEHYQPQKSMGSIQQALGFRGQTQIVSNACASGANAIGHAFHLVKSGQHQVALAGGYDALAQMVFAGFDALQALSESGIPRPFDAQRDGLAIGEGAAVLVLESEASMRARGASPVAEVCGYGMATDLHHLTQPHPGGKAAVKSMSAACRDAGIVPSEIQYINSHGTGTPLNDVAEANAIVEWAGDHASHIMVSSTKSAMGHLLGGAGAIESVVCLLALREQFVPASLNIREVDPACRFDLVREPRDTAVDTVLTNSFGFGGCNATLIFRKP